ncbi:MAG TPA: transcription termination factor Rho [Acidimicrobiales bacterium]|nr:transcription termination factor Rho [Acidimicrobiales bacterium]
MSGEQALERSVLERKERDELQTIAEALGVKPGTRTKKADLIAQILVAAGVEPSRVAEGDAGANGAVKEDKPRRSRSTRAKPAVGDAGAGGGEAAAGLPATAGPAPGAEAPAATTDQAPSGPDGVRATDAGMPAGTNGKAHEAEASPAAASTGPAEGRSGGDGDTRGAAGDAPAAPTTEAGPKPAEGRGDGHQRRDDRGPRPQQGGGGQGGQTHGGSQQGGGGQGHGGGPSTQQQPRGERQPGNFEDGGSRRSRRRRGRDRSDRDFKVQEQGSEQQYQGELVPVAGLLDLTDQGYGYVRTKGYLPSARDVYVSTSQAKRFALRKGDHVEGAARPALGNEKYGALLRIDKIGDLTVEEARHRPRFEDLTPLFPDVKLKMELPGQPAAITARIVDLLSPIGKGQRGMIVSPPKAGKTTVIKQIATSIESNNPDVHLMVLLVDERPEEVTDMRRHVRGEVVASTFDRPSEEHTIVAELAIERAKRMVEMGRDVVVILDGITRLARAYNLSAPASGRLTSGGIDQAAIYPPKKFFGAARNIEEGGSLTILATALVETGSKADDVIFEEFKGTGNMELRLDRRLAERRVYPAIDVNASSTRHEELLFERKQLELVWRLRRVLNGLADDGTSAKALELLIEKLRTTKNNDEFLAEVAKAQGTI